jgi:rRNA maturation RNase YbeY
VRLDLPLLRKIAWTLVSELLQVDSFELAIYVTPALEMARLNETFLRHQGSTDVLAFDYSESPEKDVLLGEIFICIDEAQKQALRFHTTWQCELVRYVIHGILHLLGHDDHQAVRRRKMKREENRLLKHLASRFELSKLARPRFSPK